MKKLYFWMIRDKMEVSMEFLRSNYVYIQNIRSEFEKKIYDFLNFLMFWEGVRRGLNEYFYIL